MRSNDDSQTNESPDLPGVDPAGLEQSGIRSADRKHLLIGLLLREKSIDISFPDLTTQPGRQCNSDQLLDKLVESGQLSIRSRQQIESRASEMLKCWHSNDVTLDMTGVAPDSTDANLATLDFTPRPREKSAGKDIDQAQSGKATQKKFGDYEILNEIARGGMGVVYRARQTKLGRIVALKMLRANEFADAEQISRFYGEAKAAAKLDHQGIVSLYEVGEYNGLHFYSMAFVDGESLWDLVKRKGPCSAVHAAELIRNIAEAVHYANEEGVIDRDIKPQNILIDRKGKVQITDFGLAKIQQAEGQLTIAGQILGTPSYMPPEQATGNLDQVGKRADVYSLGATLYFLLTGRPPFLASTLSETLRQAIETAPLFPRKLNPSLPRDLETICLKTLRKRREHRYETCQALADDLSRWLKGQPIVARRVSRPERLWLFCRRNPGLTGISVLAAVGVVLASLFYWYRMNDARAQGLVNSLAAAESENVPAILEELSSYRYWANSKLERMLTAGNDDLQSNRSRLNARIAMAEHDPALATALADELFEVAIEDIGNIREALRKSTGTDLAELWKVFRSETRKPADRFRAGLVLVGLDFSSADWKEDDYRFLVEQLVDSNAVFHPEYWRLLAEVDDKLIDDFKAFFVNDSSTENQKIAAANALAHFAPENALLLAEMLTMANPTQFEILHNKFKQVANAGTHEYLSTTLAKQPEADWPGAPRLWLGQDRAGAAILLLHEGEREAVFAALRYKDDPEAVTQFIHRCGSRGIEPGQLLECFEIVDERRGPLGNGRTKTDDSVMYALLLALGKYEPDQVRSPTETLIRRLEDIYARDPSSAIHGATGWLLKKWGRADLVRKVDSSPLAYDDTGNREWFVKEISYSPKTLAGAFGGMEKLHFTFVVFQPGEFEMGSLLPGPGRQTRPPVRIKITRPMAVCDRELSWEQWDAFQAGARESTSRIHKARQRPTDPAFGMTWFDAIGFCRWLSTAEGVSEDRQCYQDIGSLKIGDNGRPVDWPLNLEGQGYRLLTEAEWEYVCRSGTITDFSHGNDPFVLEEYAWTRKNATFSMESASRLPGPRGLFDMYGNQFEWCQDWYESQPTPSADPVGGNSGVNRVGRGGSWFMEERFCNSWERGGADPNVRNFFGVRLAFCPQAD